MLHDRTDNRVETPWGFFAIVSKLERRFWDAWVSCGKSEQFQLLPQVEIGRRGRVGYYRVDFGCVPLQVAVEIDGRSNHSKPEDLKHDRERQAKLESWGWRVLRFTGSEVYRDAFLCAVDVLTVLEERQERVDTWLAEKTDIYTNRGIVFHRMLGKGIVLQSQMEEGQRCIWVLFDDSDKSRKLYIDGLGYGTLRRYREVQA